MEPAPEQPAAPKLWTGAFCCAFVSHLCLAVSYFAMVLFPLYVQTLQGDEVDIGFLGAAGLGAGILLRWCLAPFWERAGSRWLFLIGGSVNLIGLLLLSRMEQLSPGLYAARCLQGAGGGLLFGAFFAYAAELLPRSRQSEGIGVFGISGMAGSYLGVWLGEQALGYGGYIGLFLTAAGAGLLSLLLSLGLPQRRVPQGAAKEAPWSAFARIWALCILFGAATTMLQFFLAPFAATRGLRPVWPFFLAYSATAIGVRLFAGSWPDRIGYRRVLWPALICFGAGLALLPWIHDHRGLVAAGVLCGAGHGYGFPVLSAMTAHRAGTGRRGRQVGLFTSFIDAGGLVGGPILGMVARSRGYDLLFWMAGAGLVVAPSLILALDRRLDPPAGAS